MKIIIAISLLLLTSPTSTGTQEPVLLPEPYVTLSTQEPLPDSPVISFPIMFTNYYPKDRTGSTHCTGSGHCTRDFDTNSLGWYMYNDMVVVAAATTHCLKSQKFGCENYNEVPASVGAHPFFIFSYYDTFEFTYDNQIYTAVVLDSCGACHRLHESDDYVQRFDIMIKSKSYSFGKIQAELLEEVPHDIE